MMTKKNREYTFVPGFHVPTDRLQKAYEELRVVWMMLNYGQEPSGAAHQIVAQVLVQAGYKEGT